MSKKINTSNKETTQLLDGLGKMAENLRQIVSNAQTATGEVNHHMLSLKEIAQNTASSAREIKQAIQVVTAGAQS